MGTPLAVASQKAFRIFERFYVLTALLFFAGGLIQRNVAEEDPTYRATPDRSYSIGQAIVYMILIPLLIIHWKKIVVGIRQAGWLLAVCALAFASAAWAIDFRYTARHGIGLTALTLFSIYIATRFDWDEQLDLFGWMSVIAVIGSVFMAVFIPSYGISQDVHWGTVKGLFPHKNVMGAQMVFAILILGLARPRGIPRLLRIATLVMAYILLVLTHSATAMLTMAVCIAMYPLLHLIRFSGKRTLPLWVPFVPLLAMAVFAGLANFESIIGATGRDTTMTGRIPMWHAILGAIHDRPWLGYGYNNFWNRRTVELVKLQYQLGFAPTHAHNGYLDVLLAFGVVGVAVCFGGMLISIWRAGRIMQADEIHGAKWPLFFLLFVAVSNLAGSAFLRPMSFYWLPYATIYVSMALAQQKHWARARQASEPSRGLHAVDFNSGLPGYPELT